MENLLESLTMGDLEELEEYSGMTFLEIAKGFEEGTLRAKVMTYIVYLHNKKVNPEATLEEARATRMMEMAARFQEPPAA